MHKEYVFSREEIIAQLQQLNAPTNRIVVVHSSLRSVGQVEGGAEALLDALIEYFTGDGGLLCVPAHTWHNLDKSITLDMSSSDNCLGYLSTVALKDGRGIRSESPIHSLVVFGNEQRAKKFVQDEPFITSTTAPESCYGKLYTEGGFVLLIGVAQNRNTYLHAVAEILNIPNRISKEAIPMTVRRTSGEIVNRNLRVFHTDDIATISHRFPKYDIPFRYHRCITDGFIGNAPTQLCDAKRMKETVELIFRNSNGIDPLRDEDPIPQEWYCR